MRATVRAVVLWIAVVASATPALAQPAHMDRISRYEGPMTCLACHPESAKEVAASLHYQQQGEPQFLRGWPKGQSAGMMLTY